MDNNDFNFIQGQIAYNFKNLDLLQQAFVRRSYANENGGEDNEVLEFIGDKVLDFVVVKLLVEKYGYFLSECDDFDRNEEFDEFVTEYYEDKLTEMKKRLVEKKMLAYRIDMLGLAKYLIMGKGDINNHVQEEDSVKEDLFEAILGAVALDSQWDISELQDVVEVMLAPDSKFAKAGDLDYVGLIQDWVSRNNKTVPLYYFEKRPYQSIQYIPFQRSNLVSSERIDKIEYICRLKIDDGLPVFEGNGNSKSEARKAACINAYEFLKENNLTNSIKKEIRNPNKAEAINQLEILARRGYFSIPTYKFCQEYDKNGNPVWKCECRIKEKSESFFAKSSSKKESKKTAAFKMMKYILKEK